MIWGRRQNQDGRATLSKASDGKVSSQTHETMQGSRSTGLQPDRHEYSLVESPFHDQDRAAGQFEHESPLKPGEKPAFDEQDRLAAEFEKGASLSEQSRKPFDEEDKAAIWFRTDPPILPVHAPDSACEDRFASDFERTAPLSGTSEAFCREDRFASRFKKDVVLQDNVYGTALAGDGAELVKEPDVERSIYYVYQRKQRRHFVLSSEADPNLEKIFPSWKEIRRKQKLEREVEEAKAAGAADASEEAGDGYFVHKPALGFHVPPRTLRRSTQKDGTPICLLYNSFLWRRWKLLLGEEIGRGDVIDPRGAISYTHHTPRRERQELDFKGYKVGKWRMCGESGKQYVRRVNAERRGKRLATGDPQQTDEQLDEDKIGKRARAEEAVYLSWTSPFSNNSRRYHFRYAGIDFYWKGTGTVKESRTCGMLVRFNHLKLVARVSIDGNGDDEPALLIRTESKLKREGLRFGRLFSTDRAATHEICLAKYTSSVAMKKAGTLVLYDQVIHRFVQDYVIDRGIQHENLQLGRDIQSVKKTRLYDLIVATAMCMIIAEWQKRETIRKIVEAASTYGSSGH